MKFTTLFLVLLLALVSRAGAVTRVSVVELGKHGSVRRTDSRDPLTTVAGVASFWSALHAPGRKLQHAGMTIVPDLFNVVENGIVIFLKGGGVNLASMPFVSSLLGNGANGVVGHFEVHGNSGDALLDSVKDADIVDASAFSSSCKRHASSPGLTGMMTVVESGQSAAIDGQLQELFQVLEQEAAAAGKTVVVHLIVENDNASSHSRHLARRLQDEDEGEGEQNNNEENKGEEGEENNNNNNGAGEGNNNNGNAQQQQSNGYYGYGYYNSYGEWVTPYKTMFQIQYFNVVLWTSIGLAVILFFTVYLMLNMPLMPDTLLFGESAKLMPDD